MNCYFYDENTKEFCGVGTVDKDPEESIIQNKFIPLIPANATLEAPPETSSGKKAVFDGNNWTIKQDYRGLPQIELKSLAVTVVDYIGDIKVGYMLLSDYYDSDEYKLRQEQERKKQISMLSMTKYDFYKYVCKPNNISYSELMELVNTNEDIAAAWNLCERIYRGDELLNKYAKSMLNLTDTELDSIFEEVNNGIYSR